MKDGASTLTNQKNLHLSVSRRHLYIAFLQLSYPQEGWALEEFISFVENLFLNWSDNTQRSTTVFSLA